MKAELASGEGVIAERVTEAKGFFARLRGLMYNKKLPAGQGLLIEPCNSIHTFGMRFSIDVLFLDSAGRILRAVRSLRPGRVFGPVKGGNAVLEMAAGSLPPNVDLEGKVVRFSG